MCQHIFHQITTPPLASSRNPRPKYLIRDYTPGRKLKIKAFQREDVWDLYVSLNSNFNTYVDSNSNDSGTKFKRSWGHMCNHCWKMLLNKKLSKFVQQHLHVKRCWTKSPQQRINRTVSTQRRTRVCWLVLESSIGAVGLSTLRNMLENHPLNRVILPIFPLLFNGAIPKLKFLVSGRISVVMSTFSVSGLSYGRSGNKFCAEEGQNPIFDPLPRNEKLCGNLYSKFALRNGLPTDACFLEDYGNINRK